MRPSGGAEHSPGLVERIARSGAWNVIGYAATAGAALGVSVIAARRLGPSRYGDYSYVMWVVRTAAVLGAIGIPAAATRMISEALGANDPGRAGAVFRQAVRSHLLLTPGLLAVVAAILFYRGRDATLAIAMGVATVGLTLVYTFEQSLAGFRRFQLAARNASIVAISQLALILVAAMTGVQLTGFLLLQGIAALVAVAIWGGVTGSAFSRLEGGALPDPERRRFYRLAGLMAIVALSDGILWGRPELFFLERWWSEREVGLYSAALVLATLTSSLPLIASRVLTPEFSWLRGGGKEESLREAFPRVCTVVALVAIPLGVGGAIVARDLLILAFGSSFVSAATTASIAMAGSVFVAVAGPASSATVTGPDPGFMAKLAAGLAIVNLGLDLALIRRFGMIGAASATMVSQALSIVVVIAYVRVKLGLRYPMVNLMKILGCAAVASYAGKLAAAGHEGAAALAVAVPVAAILFGLGVIATGVVDMATVRAATSRRRRGRA